MQILNECNFINFHSISDLFDFYSRYIQGLSNQLSFISFFHVMLSPLGKNWKIDFFNKFFHFLHFWSWRDNNIKHTVWKNTIIPSIKGKKFANRIKTRWNSFIWVLSILCCVFCPSAPKSKKLTKRKIHVSHSILIRLPSNKCHLKAIIWGQNLCALILCFCQKCIGEKFLKFGQVEISI